MSGSTVRAIIDIETAPVGAVLGEPIDVPESATAGIAPPKSYKKQATIDRWWEETAPGLMIAAREAWVKAASLSPATGRIVAIGLHLEGGDCSGPDAVWNHTGADEGALLEAADGWLAARNVTSLAAWNGGAFDFPFIRGRVLRARIRGPLWVMTRPHIYRGRAFWSQGSLDDPSERCIARAMGRSGWGLQKVARSYGIEVSTLPGSEVARLWAAGDLEAIGAHVREDVYLQHAVCDLEDLWR